MRRGRLIPFLSMMLALGVPLAQATPARASASRPVGRIAFGSDRYGGTHNIFTMNADGSGVRQLTFITAAQGAFQGQSWSPDGTRLVFNGRDAAATVRQLYVMNADGSGMRLLFPDPGYLDFEPGYSPDGSLVIFARCRPDFEACAIYTVTSDGKNLTAVTPLDVSHNILDRGPEYSPDGKTIAFASFNRGGVIAAVYVMGAHGANVRQVTPAYLEALEPDWSPDGSHILFDTHCCNPLHSAIWRARSDGTQLKQLTVPGQQHDFTPESSPAGGRVAFERDAPDFSTFGILTMNADGTHLVTIQANAFFPAWGPAG